MECYASKGKVNHGLEINVRILQARERVEARQKEEIEHENAFFERMELLRKEEEEYEKNAVR